MSPHGALAARVARPDGAGAEDDGVGALLPRVVGRSARTAVLRRQLAAAARCDASVLLTGETGTGKEVAAWSIHEASERRRGPLVVVDCGAIASELAESELFGHERGAFTGAVGTKVGLFEAASGGTIFLDEIGELPLALQPKLLRVLESRTVRRVGGQRSVPVDVRVIAATHRDLPARVREGAFREDLYYRLAVLSIELPALRERREDVPLLVEHFGRGSAVVARVAREHHAELASYAWPGNVRELRNHVERCAALGAWAPLAPAWSAGDELRASSDESAERAIEGVLGADGTRPYAEEKLRWLQQFERAYLLDLLRVHEGNVRAAARTAGIDRAYVYRLLWRHGLR